MNLLEKYRFLVDELGQVDLSEMELKVFRTILDLSLGEEREKLFVTAKKDLEYLTGIRLKNLIPVIKSLASMGMLLCSETERECKSATALDRAGKQRSETRTEWVFQVVANPYHWIVKERRRIDRVLYYRTLNGLRSHNQITQPHLRTLEPSKGLNDVLAQDALESLISPTRGPGVMPAPHRTSHGDCQDAGNSEDGNNGESARVSEYGKDGPPHGGPNPPEVKHASNGGATSPKLSLLEMFRKQMAGEVVIESSTEPEPRPNEQGKAVLESSTPEGETPGQVLESSTSQSIRAGMEGPPVLNSSTDNPLESNDPECRVLDSSTEVPSRAHTRARLNVKRLTVKDKLNGKRLTVRQEAALLGRIHALTNESEMKFWGGRWRNAARQNAAALQSAIVDMEQTRREEARLGLRSEIKAPGKYLWGLYRLFASGEEGME